MLFMSSLIHINDVGTAEQISKYFEQTENIGQSTHAIKSHVLSMLWNIPVNACIASSKKDKWFCSL